MKSLRRQFFFIYSMLFSATLLLPDAPVNAQSGNDSVLTLDAVFRLAEQNSSQLKVVEQAAVLARQHTEIVQLDKLPGISSSLDYGYISNADIWNPSFSEHQKGQTPHHFTQLTISAAQLIFQGNLLNMAIEKSKLEELIAQLNVDKRVADIRFLVMAKYLDIYRLINQAQIYTNNTNLAKERLRNIEVMRKQGMVTENDLLRTQLIISDYELAKRRTENNLSILYSQLNVVLGLADSTRFLPDSTILNTTNEQLLLFDLLDTAHRHNQELKIAAQDDNVAETAVRMAKAERLPGVYAYAATNLQRPFLNTIPSVDIYYNVWRTGVLLRYNISSIYQSPKKIRVARERLELSHKQFDAARESVDLSTRAAFVQHLDAMDQLETYRRDMSSALENYRIVEKKYFNQLALQADMIDAANLKTEAELRVTNASIQAVYTYYQIRKAIGKL